MIYNLRNTFSFHLRTSVLITALFFPFIFVHAQQSHPEKGWTVHDPFVHDVFIENKGQFNDEATKNVGEQILYYSHKGNAHIFFSPTSFTFEHDSVSLADPDEKPTSADDDDAKINLTPVFMRVTWDGANSNARVEVQNEAEGYFTYRNPKDKSGHSSVLCHAWKKIIYHNLYNNIDVSFYYTADKKALEYDITVYPGGDISQVKMHYSKNANLTLINNAIHIASPCLNLSDRAPIAKDENGAPVSTSFSLNKNIVSFNTSAYDRSKILIIDPAYTSPTTFAGTNKGYDLNYDLAGNVYVMGSGDQTEYQLQKYNASGTWLWTWTATFPVANQLVGGYFYYGGYTTDSRSGSSYIAEGLDYKSATGCAVEKISSAGALVTNYPGNSNVDEIWKMAFDYCDNQIIIGAGQGTNNVTFQGATMDTNCTTMNPVNVLGAPAGSTHHDIAMITFDGVGKCYFATTQPAAGGNAGYSNKLLQLPSATLAPTAYQVYDASTFIETASVPYYPALPSGKYIYCGNGFNGLIADLNFVATYDGNKLRTWTPATGAAIDSVVVSPNVQESGGIAIDCDENIYVGNANKVSVYSKTLGLVNTLSLTSAAATDSIYDLHIAPTNILYACGNGFVSATPVTIPKMLTTTSTSPNSCGCVGTASATVCDNYPYTYSWSNGATTSSVTGLCPGQYTVTVVDASCNPRQDTAIIHITGSSGLTASVTPTNVKCFGETNGSASVVATGTGPFTYKWTDGTTSTSDTGLAAGTYSCVVSNTTGCVDTEKFTITQPAALAIQANTSPATCFTTCDGQANVFLTGGTSPYTYAWSNGGSNANINNMCVGNTYTCNVTDTHGCKIDTSLAIANPPPIVLGITETPELCGKLNGSATVTASGGTPGYTYTWSTGTTTSGGTSSTISGVSADLYTVMITDKNGCTADTSITVGFTPGDSIKIVSQVNELCFGGNTGSATAQETYGTAPFTYSWAPAPASGTTTTATGLTAGNYTITMTDSNGCINWAVATITQPSPVTVTIPPDTICIGQQTTLTATGAGGTPGYTYLWNSTTTGDTSTVNPKTTTSYNVQATDANGCQSPVTPVQVVVRNPLIVVVGPPTSMCPGNSVILSATGAGGDGVFTYTWSPAAGLSATTGISVTASPTVTTTYTVVLHDGCGTPQASDSVPVTIYPLPVVKLVADTLQGCAPLCVKFTNLTTVAGGTIASSHWTFGDGTTSDSTNPTHCYTNAGVYSVGLTVISNNGCTDSVMILNYITVYSHPVANFVYTPQPATIMNPTIYFTDRSTDAYGIANWFWQFGDGSDSSGIIKDPQHTYADTGWYCVNLEVTNIHNCTAATTQCIYIEPFFVIYVPNAFTPNGNGLNDYFTAKGVGILDFQMWIFDRWGQQIYYTTEMNPGWNGIVQGGSSGQRAQEDTYVWLIEATDVFHKDHRLIGKVTLIK